MDFIATTSCLYMNCMNKCRYERKERGDERKGEDKKDERREERERGEERRVRGGLRKGEGERR